MTLLNCSVISVAL